MPRGIILLDELNMCGKFMRYITENMDRKGLVMQMEYNFRR